jgi:SSS family solute:Na+ symporter
LITVFGLSILGGDGGMSAGANLILEDQRERFNSVGSRSTTVPFGAIFSGIFLLHLFYWTTNQQIIQRTFAASSLAEGQKGVLLTGAFKLLGPLYLVIPGMIAFSLFPFALEENVESNMVYGKLVSAVLPDPLTGFFAAVMIGAILSSFNSALNSSCTLFSLGLYKDVFNKNASEAATVRSGKIFGWTVAVISMVIAPFLHNQGDIFDYLQKMNGMYSVPIFSVVLIGMLTGRVPSLAAKIALVGGVSAIAIGYFVEPFSSVVDSMHEFYFLGIVFTWLAIFMLVMGAVRPRETEFVQEDVGAVDMTSWRLVVPAGILLLICVVAIYACFADFSVLQKYSG